MALWALKLAELNALRLGRLAPCARSTSKAVTGCAKVGRWSEAIALLQNVFDKTLPVDSVDSVDVFGINGMMRACSARWSVALRGLAMAAGLRVQPDVCSFSTLLSAAEQASAWGAALAINCEFEKLGLPDRVFNLLISSTSKANKWRASLIFFERLAPKSLRPNEISLSVATRPQTWSHALNSLLKGVRSNLRPECFAVAARSAAWQWPLHCLQHMRTQTLSTRSLPLQTSCVEFCRKWQLVLSIALHPAEAPLDVRFFSAAMSSCVACERPDVALFLLWTEAESGVFRSPVDHLWALARLEVRDPEIIHRAFQQALQQALAQSAQASQVSALWWSSAVLCVSGGTRDLFWQTMKILQKCTERELMLVSWGMAVDPHGLQGLLRCQQEMALRIQIKRMSPHFIQSVLGVMWSSAFRNASSFRFNRIACEALEQFGKALDQDCAEDASEDCLHDLQVARDGDAKRIFESQDVAVLYKPSGWEVYNTQTRGMKGSLLSFLRTRPSKLLTDASVSFGFLHRLDVPSSGLIIAAKTYRSFYSLQAQLAAGAIERSYVALCHSLATTRFIEASLSWISEAEASLTSAGFGKYAKTLVEALRWKLKASRATSLLKIQILTGRRHQIRSHCSHVGRPIICDARYTSEMTFQEDCTWCPRNFLHRNRLVFHLAASGRMDIRSELPSDLSICLENLQSKGKI